MYVYIYVRDAEVQQDESAYIYYIYILADLSADTSADMSADIAADIFADVSADTSADLFLAREGLCQICSTAVIGTWPYVWTSTYM